MASAWDFDVAVIGGGPGGSSAATALARRGRTVLLLERDRFPRFHIGESQLPWSNEVFRALDVHDAIAEAGFVKKWGASFRTVDGATEQYADFQFAAETPSPQTFQVPRATFDEVLLRHSERSGAKVLEEHRALDAAFEPDGVVLRFVGPDGTEQAVRVGFVVDASGRTGFLTKKLGHHEFDPVLRNIAVHAQYEGIPRLEGRRAGDIRMFTRADMGWIWLIPISQSVTSVGAVIPQSVHRRESKAVPEDSLTHYLTGTAGLAPLLAHARRVSPARFDADYSYLGSSLAGDRWIAVGDAAAFLDPIFSTGVLLAMQAGLEAAEAIDDSLREGEPARHRFAACERLVRQRYHHFRRFAVGFYDPYFRDLWFRPASRLGIFGAILSVLAGNWRPSWMTRQRIRLPSSAGASRSAWGGGPMPSSRIPGAAISAPSRSDPMSTAVPRSGSGTTWSSCSWPRGSSACP
ncbi:MAG: tryptophan halogenase [Candidatus Rokuibacteriota bacterium]|nr:MAG: tryptophan halogenase [Candidatus Rokubacteria bacterium]